VTTTKELLKKQIEEIPKLRELSDAEEPQFKEWTQLTQAIIERKLGKEKKGKFDWGWGFWPNHMGPWDSYEKKESLLKGLTSVEAYLSALIRETEIFGEDELVSSIQTNKQSKNTRYGNISVSGGTVVLGDGNKITQVSVKELVEALEGEIEEKVVEGEERKSVLRGLKEITTNETFAAVAGTVIGEVLRRMTRP